MSDYMRSKQICNDMAANAEHPEYNAAMTLTRFCAAYQSEDGYQDDNKVKFVPAVAPILGKTETNYLRHQESIIIQAMQSLCRAVLFSSALHCPVV